MHKIMTISCFYKWCVYIVSQVFVWSALGVAVGEAKSLVRAPLEPKLVPNCRKRQIQLLMPKPYFQVTYITSNSLSLTAARCIHHVC